MNWLDSIIDFAGRIFGKAELVVHHPLEPIKPYMAEVCAGVLWRGSWPSEAMLAELKAKGVGVVINLCAERQQDDEVEAAGMYPVNIGIEDDTVPTLADIERFLGWISIWGMVYVHCEAGEGRTGCAVAIFRVLVQKWTPEAALAEAESFGLALPAQKRFILGLRRKNG